jgi:hypothetical protein
MAGLCRTSEGALRPLLRTSTLLAATAEET